MLATSSYTWLFFMAVCCWHCMALKDHGKKHVPAHSSHSNGHSHSHSRGHSHSNEHSHSDEHSHSNECSCSGHKAPTCTDRKRNQGETDIDCGGKKCAKCADGQRCKLNRDCISGSCKCKRCVQQPTKPTKPVETTTTTEMITTSSLSPSTTTTTETTTPEITTTPELTTTESTINETSTTTSEIATTEATINETSTTPELATTESIINETSTTTPELATAEATINETSTTTPEIATTESTINETSTTPELATTETTINETTTSELTTNESTTNETSTTPEPTTAESTINETSTTPESTTNETTTTSESITTETTTIIPICDPECKNDGICIDNNVCTCITGFSGPTCEIQSVGLCLNNETFDTEPILLITFGNGSAQYSTAIPNDFEFNTTYQQRFEPVTNDGMFSFVNSVHNDFNNAWHTGATDHTGDVGGYMYLVNANFQPGQFYNGRVDNLCIGLRYEFSVYLANLCKPSGKISPYVLFEVRSTDENILLAQLNSGDVVEQETLTWEKYGFSFIARNSSVNLLMISNAPGGIGNDLVIDDIALRVCAHRGSGFCPSK